MKKLLLIAILMLALVFTVVACTTEKTPEGTTAGETTATPGPQETEPQATEPQATEPQATEPQATEPQATEPQATEPQETEPQETEPVTTADPMLPVNVFDAEAIKTLTGQNGIESVEVVDGVLHVVPNTADPYWYPFANVDGARYVVIRYRTADATGADIQFYLGSTGSGPSDDSSMLRMPVIVDGEWHLAIFDTQPLIDAGKYDGSTVAYFRFDPLEAGYMLDENGEPYKPDGQNYARYDLPVGCSIDISYIGFFHSEEAAVLYDAAPIVIDDAASIAGKVAGAVKGSEVKTENGGTYITLVSTADDPWFMLQNGLNKVGNYLAVSYRTNGTSNGEFFVGSGAGPQGGVDEAHCQWIGDEKWHLMVIDLSAVEGLTSITDGVVNYLRLDPFVDHVPEDQGRYLDIGFIALFETAADAEAYYSVVNCEVKDIKNTFASDVTSNAVDTTIDATDLNKLFQFGLNLGDYKTTDSAYKINGISEMFTNVNGKYAFTVGIQSTPSVGAAFVRGYHAVNSVDLPAQEGDLYVINNYYETDGAGFHGGAGIFSTLADGNLYILVKKYDDASKTHVSNYICSVPDMPASGNLTMADDGDTVYILVDGVLYATVALSGETSYEKISTEGLVFAKTAVVTLADGTTETIENTLVAATCNAQVGFAVRGGDAFLTSVKLEAFSAIEIPSDDEPTDEPTEDARLVMNKTEYVLGEAILVTAIGEGTDWIGIAERGAAETVAWWYVANIGSGTEVDLTTVARDDGLDWTFAPGEYTLYLVPNDQSLASGANAIAAIDFVITAADPS